MAVSTFRMGVDRGKGHEVEDGRRLSPFVLRAFSEETA